jgi:hypothetical protein
MNILKISLMATVIATFAACGDSENKCEHKTDATETTATAPADSATTAAAYVCPMHPKVTGKKGDTCSECAMDLELVK